MHKESLSGYEALREVRGLERVIRIPDIYYSHSSGRDLEDWCYDNDDESTYENVTNMDDSCPDLEDMFDKLEEAMERPHTKTYKASLATKNKKAVILGGKKEIFKKFEEDHMLADADTWMAGLPKSGEECSCYRGDREHYPV